MRKGNDSEFPLEGVRKGSQREKRNVTRGGRGEGMRGVCDREEAYSSMNNGEQLYYFDFLK